MKRAHPHFGNFAKQYDAMRPEYPGRAIAKVRRTIRGERPLILDIGCGTGISTRQMARARFNMIGCDFDPAMLRVAKKRGGRGITYVRADARQLPFKSALFDGVTAFTALHWFLDAKPLSEVRRVLKPGGALCVVQPEHTAPFRGDLNKIISKRYPKRRVAQYRTERFSTALKRAGFKRINETVFETVYTYTLAQYLVLIQTYSVWNRVPVGERGVMLGILKKHFATRLVRGRIRDTQEITVTIGLK